MVFKIARKPPKDAKDNAWQYAKTCIPIPREALDIASRRAPKEFSLVIPTLYPSSPALPTPSVPIPESNSGAGTGTNAGTGTGTGARTSKRRSSSISSMEDEI
jgi:hypothetical protein